jgi:hypothetical protein
MVVIASRGMGSIQRQGMSLTVHKFCLVIALPV